MRGQNRSVFCKEQCHGGEGGQVGGAKRGRQGCNYSRKMPAGMRVGMEGGTSGLTRVLQQVWWASSGAEGREDMSLAVLPSSSSNPGSRSGL